ncbi:hypothetical protein FA95DRAFT_1568169 [Auriscalpium vulgare]|uniref:Uncharacterized protein n=1 Tax=Auriscalpium vulgare TaxID=40419 RepID=A0ACB8R0F4_9AGAM|nr:hypothetical protein FA95DRAFT_1568169 [Auriscalpium vulgare]
MPQRCRAARKTSGDAHWTPYKPPSRAQPTKFVAKALNESHARRAQIESNFLTALDMYPAPPLCAHPPSKRDPCPGIALARGDHRRLLAQTPHRRSLKPTNLAQHAGDTLGTVLMQ